MESGLTATNHKNNENAVHPYSHQIMETVFNMVQEGVSIIDQNGYLVDINEEGCRVHDFDFFTKDHLINKPFKFINVLNEEGQELPLSMWPVTRLLAHESFNNEHYRVKIYEDSPEIKVTYSGVPQFDKEGNFIAGILFSRSFIEDDTQSMAPRTEFIDNEQSNQLEIFQQQLKEDRELLQVIIDTIPVMVTIYDKRFQTFIMNSAVETITGWSYHDIGRTSIMELAYPDPEYRKEISDYMKSLTPGFKDIVMRTSDGRDIETSWANVEIPDGRQVGVGIDISERKRLEKELIEARKKAEKENEVQYAFIQNVSHEVRTPMNSILGFTELLQKELVQKKEREFLNAIYFNGKQLLRLIDDIIDFSQLDSNKISVQNEVIHLNKLMKQIGLQMKGMKKALKKRHLELIMKHSDNHVHAVLNTDSLRLQQVLLNLISNAIKYTEEGSVEVGYEIREEKHDILFYVKDTGIGIDVENEKQVFKRFNRLHDTRRQEFRGTGLGLAICKHLVKLLGGEIWFESEPGKGTVFFFSHPYQVLQSNERESDVDEIASDKRIPEVVLPDLSNKVILIVEDDSFSYMMMYHMLEESKAIILHADSGRKAIEIFDKYKIDLVFLDIRLPEMDGYQVIRYMHQINSKLPVVAQTANALPEDNRKIREAGFNYTITKPISRDSLVNVLNKFF